MKARSPLTETEKEQAKIQAAGGKTPSGIARGMGRSHHTIQKFLCRPEVQKQVNVQKEELAGMFDQVAHRIVNSVTDTDVVKANLVQKMTSAGIAVDKAALLRSGLPRGIDLTAMLDLITVIRMERDNQNERQWPIDHAKCVPLTKDANCPAHKLALPAPNET